MRAKMRVASVSVNTATAGENAGKTLSERVQFNCVAKSDGPYPADGSDENNTFARYSPDGQCGITIQNPALFGAHVVGDEFYVDFIKVPKPAA